MNTTERSKKNKNSDRRWLVLYLLFLPFITLCVCMSSTLGSLGLLPSSVQAGIEPVVTADYRPWDYPILDIDLEGLSTAVVEDERPVAVAEGSTPVLVEDATNTISAPETESTAQAATPTVTSPSATEPPASNTATPVTPSPTVTVLTPSPTATLTATAPTPTNAPPPTPTNAPPPTATNTPTPTPPPAQADLRITNTDGRTSVSRGETLTYTITVANLSASQSVSGAAVDASFDQNRLSSLTWSCTPTTGASCTGSGSGLITDSVSLPAGASVTYTVTALVSTSATAGTISSTSTVTAPISVTDPNLSNNTSIDTTTLDIVYDLDVDVGSPDTTVSPGDTVTVDISVDRISGADDPTGILISDSTPAWLTNVSWVCLEGNCGAGSSTGYLSDTFSMPPYRVRYQLTGTIVSNPPSNSLTYTAGVTIPAGQTDTIAVNNTAGVTFNVLPQALVVTNTTDASDLNPGDGFCEDGGGCSLRAALEEVTALGGTLPIHFNIPGSGPHIINPVTEYPNIATDTIVIDATTQPGYAGTPLVILDGTGTGVVDGGVTEGFDLRPVNSGTIRGLEIRNFDDGLDIADVGDVLVEANVLRDNNDGVGVSDSSNVRIQNNVIYGNTRAGIHIRNNSTSVNVTNNRIGVDGPNQNGIRINNATATSITNNHISNNSDTGIWLQAGAVNTIIIDNRIGTTADGNAALGNGLSGIMVEGGSNFVRIQSNVISGNGNDGITIHTSDNITIESNRIGISQTGSNDVGNGRHGVLIDGGPGAVTDVGVGSVGFGNVIAFNNDDGVTVRGGGTTVRNTIRGNSIFANVNIGIDLNDGFVTPNDPGDTDGGPNTILNFPDGYTNPTQRIITLQNIANGGVVDFYISDNDSSGHGEGQTYLFSVVDGGSGDLDGAANGSIRVDLSATGTAMPTGTLFTTTATDNFGNTSEFGPNYTAP